MLMCSRIYLLACLYVCFSWSRIRCVLLFVHCSINDCCFFMCLCAICLYVWFSWSKICAVGDVLHYIKSAKLVHVIILLFDVRYRLDILLLYHCSTIPLYHYIMLLLCYYLITLLYYYIIILLYCYIIILLYYYIIILLSYYIIILLHYYIITLLYYYTIILLHYYIIINVLLFDIYYCKISNSWQSLLCCFKC